jgi:3-hydroxyisobutyrate dehydrogenase-like beta-hydroxyacid dehydrogenase
MFDVESNKYTVGILHPGMMGISVAASFIQAGNEVLWASDDRSIESKSRAKSLDSFEDTGWLNGLVNRSKLIISVVPPHAAKDVAFDVSSLGFRGIYIDANAISPNTAQQVADEIESSGATYIDGGIIGPPAETSGSTRLYLSGDEAIFAAGKLNGGPLEVIPLSGNNLMSASTLKMAYAGWTKGTNALLIGLITLAQQHGVLTQLFEEWDKSQPALRQKVDSLSSSVSKAWRFSGEMEEIADTFEQAHLPDGFHRAAADIYRNLAVFKDSTSPPAREELALELIRILQLERKELDA